ncbi:MAG: hypothetical protein WCJ99_18565, partial [Betaproteobacteria bacterium]
ICRHCVGTFKVQSGCNPHGCSLFAFIFIIILDNEPKMKNQGKMKASGSFVVGNTPLRQAHASL